MLIGNTQLFNFALALCVRDYEPCRGALAICFLLCARYGGVAHGPIGETCGNVKLQICAGSDLVKIDRIPRLFQSPAVTCLGFRVAQPVVMGRTVNNVLEKSNSHIECYATTWLCHPRLV